LSDIEVVGRIERRRIWSAREKAALLAEVDAEGGKVRLVARRHRISESLLYNWRSARKAAAIAAGAAESVAFVPVGVIESADSGDPEVLALPNPEPSRPPSFSAGKAGAIEIAMPNGARICVDAFVNETALARVLRAMKRST
jgi:transposase-like protein